ncbi:MAG: M4 family metallopeptidase [Bacteroidetes bacterium]|nr:M4 family metallopeptidase [Bacteroidota bacterium]
MRKIYSFVLSSILFLIPKESLFGQNQVKLFELMHDSRTGLPRYAEVSSETPISENDFFIWLNSQYQLPEGSTFVLYRSEKDEIGFTHNKYKQYYRGVEVLHSMLIVHIKNGIVESFNGEYFNRFENNQPATSPTAARDLVIASFGSGVKFRWENPEKEREIKFIKNDPDATWYPKTITDYYSYPESYDGKTPLIYCYAVEVALENPYLHEQVLVDAATGKMFRTIQLEIHSDSAGKANTHYEGVKNFTTDFIMKDSFRLREKTKRNIETYRNTAGTDYFDADNYWNNSSQKIGGDIHYAAELVSDFMKIFFNRKSYDSKGGVILSVATSGSGNAFWNLGSNFATFLVGSSSGVGPCASLDVVGHEFGHGIADENAGLLYSGEACALHESFADISGHMTEFVNDSATANWYLGEKVWTGSNGIRYMRNPHKFNDPKAYGGQYFPKGCHGSGGVQNYWFYLMVNGDTATNEFSYAYKLSGLGHWKAVQITYRSYFYYITPSATFKDAMKGAIKAAKDLYGSCSYELDYTYKAWKAVNVEDTSVKTVDLSHGIKAPGLLCNGAPVNATLSSYGDNSRIVAWKVDHKDTSTQRSWTYKFNNTGSFHVKLTTNTCGKIFEDSMYITVNYLPKPAFTRPFDSACESNNSYKFVNNTVNADSKIALHYYWYLNPGAVVDTLKDFTTKFPVAADYEVTLKAYYMGGCWSITKQMLTILEGPKPDFTVLKDVCENRPLRVRNFTDTVNKTVAFKWYFPDNSTYSGFEPKNNSLTTAGIYNIILEATYPYGNCSDTAMRKVKILPNPKPDFTWKNNCKNTDVILISGGTSSAGKEWNQWHLGTFNPINKDTFVFNSGDSTQRTIGYTLGDTLGCYATKYKTIVMGTLDGSLSIIPVCLGDSSTLNYTFSSTETPSIQWDLGNGVTKTGKLPSYTYTNAGNYNVLYTLKTSTCNKTISAKATVKTKPTVDFITSNECDGDTAFFINKSAGKDTINFEWNYGDNTGSFGTDAWHLYAPGITRTFNVNLIGTYNNGCGNNKVNQVTIYELPECTFTSDFDVTAGNNGFNFKPKNTGLKRYHWDFGDGDTSNLAQPFHRYNSNGVFTAKLQAWSQQGCACGITQQVEAKFSGITEIKNNGITIYPNPAENTIYIDIKDGLKLQYILRDITGKTILTGTAEKASTSISVAQLPRAPYLLEVISEKGNTIYPVVLK